MKSTILWLGLALACAGAPYVYAETEPAAEAVKEEVKAGPAYCPICGPEEKMESLAFSYKHEGTKYKFCSLGCLKAFKKNPEEFLKGETGPKGHRHE